MVSTSFMYSFLALCMFKYCLKTQQLHPLVFVDFEFVAPADTDFAVGFVDFVAGIDFVALADTDCFVDTDFVADFADIGFPVCSDCFVDTVGCCAVVHYFHSHCYFH